MLVKLAENPINFASEKLVVPRNLDPKKIGDPFKFCFGKVNIFYIKFARNKFREINHRLKNFALVKSVLFSNVAPEKEAP